MRVRSGISIVLLQTSLYCSFRDMVQYFISVLGNRMGDGWDACRDELWEFRENIIGSINALETKIRVVSRELQGLYASKETI